MKTILIRFSHGLGDAVQASVVLKHLSKYRADWTVDCWGLRGKESAWYGLCRQAFHDGGTQPDDDDYDRVFCLDWWENHDEYPDRPNTKITNCLQEVFGIEYDPALGRYAVAVPPAKLSAAAGYLESIGCRLNPDGRYDAVLLHYQGNTHPERKNLGHDHAAGVVEAAIEAGHVPVVLDWDGRSPLPDGRRVFKPAVGEGDLWGGFGSGDAAAITALIARSAMFVGIDSGPGKCASATETPTLIVWTGHHPVQFHDPAPNTLHLIPEHHRALGPAAVPAVTAFFEANYRFTTYPPAGLRAALYETVRQQLGGSPSASASPSPLPSPSSLAGVDGRPEGTIVAFSFCSDHAKSGVGTIPAADHFRMLGAAMRCADRKGVYPKLVSAIGAIGGGGDGALLTAAAPGVPVTASPVNPGHQQGAALAIRQALEYAQVHRFEFLVFLAEDVVCLEMDLVARMTARLAREGLDYIGRPWSAGGCDDISTQVFACRVSAMFDAAGCVVQAGDSYLEDETLRRLRQRARRVRFDMPLVYDTHDPDQLAAVADPILRGAAGPLDPHDPAVVAVAAQRWTYRRVGYDQRPMTLLPDGTIGKGAGGCERTWRLHRRPGGTLGLDVIGDGGVLFRADPTDDGRWVGRWLYGERMPAELIPHGHPLHEPDDSPLAARFRECCEAGTDISEHVPLLWAMGRLCKHVTELGTRSAVSTSAFLFARPERLICYDLERHPEVDELAAAAGDVEFVFRQQDVLQARLEPTDLLFIDTFHTASQLRQELALHADKPRRWIVLHDTTTFGERGEDGGEGLWPAVEGFLASHPHWHVRERLDENNGLTVLERSRTGRRR